ncbi:MAG: cupin domain-containing protein [Actinomycetota bacterium]|nr:cupin domain-containing protein [Actinomycetota bacterium]
MDDGTEVIIAAGDLFSIPAGHDSWVLGDEEYVSLHFLGAQDYAARSPERRMPLASVRPPTPIDPHDAADFSWGDGCEGWTLLADPQLHVVRERMPAGTAEQRHQHEHTAQLYVILDGEATVEVSGDEMVVTTGQSIELPKGVTHQIRNETADPLEFLVASSQAPRQDRIDLP